MLDNLMSLVMGLLMIGFGLFCGVMAANLIYQHAANWRAAVRSKSWLTTEGQVTAAMYIVSMGLSTQVNVSHLIISTRILRRKPMRLWSVIR